LTRYRIHINKLVLEYDTIKDMENETVLFNTIFIVNASSNHIAYLHSADFRNLHQQCSHLISNLNLQLRRENYRHPSRYCKRI